MESDKDMTGRQVKEQLVINAAVKLFCRKGAEKTKVVEITKEAGIGKSTFYEYFVNKGDLICRWFEIMMADIQDTIPSLPAPQNSGDKIRAIVMANCSNALANQEFITMFLELWRLAFNEKDPKANELIKGLYQQYLQMTCELIDQGIAQDEFKKCDVRMTAAAILGGIDGLWLQYLVYGEEYDIELGGRTFIETMLAGMAK